MAFNAGTMTVADPSMVPARDDYVEEDVKEIPGVPKLPAGYSHTDFIRRLLLKGKPTEHEGFEAMICADLCMLHMVDQSTAVHVVPWHDQYVIQPRYVRLSERVSGSIG